MISPTKIIAALYRTPKIICLVVLLLFNAVLFAQQITVLPGNNNYSQQSGPQGSLRSQRQFYLIRPAEVQASGLAAGVINKIGFTLGVAQSNLTKGAFKVWLQNTTDQVSRVDSSWTEVTIPGSGNSYSTRFFPGDYEVQIIPICSATAQDTARIVFSNSSRLNCRPPTGLKTQSIAAFSAVFSWVAPVNVPAKYKIMYKRSDTAYWRFDSTAGPVTSYTALNLIPNKNYEWRVWSSCSDSTQFAATNFATAINSQCNPPTSLIVFRLETSATDTLAVLKWDTTGNNFQFYSINYRRVGTANWITTISPNDSVVLRHLLSGTNYEWQIKTNCPAGSGSFIPGPNFTTLGTTRCFAPYNLSVNSITDSTATIAWDLYPGVTSHKLRYRLKGTIPWTTATSPMTLVFNDSITIPAATGVVSVDLSPTFNYTANSGLYVAFEYRKDTGALPNPNTTVSTTVDSVIRNVNGGDSIRYILSYSSRLDSGLHTPDSIVTHSDYRPETIVGAASMVDSVAVLAVWTLGKTVPQYQDSTFVSAQISNRSLTVDRKFGVQLMIKNQSTAALRYTRVDSITVRAGIDTMITFRAWLPTQLENDSVIVSIDPRPSETITNNNSKGYLQSVNSYVLAYADNTAPMSQVGFDTSPGLLLTKYTMKGCGKVIAAQVFLAKSAAGHPLYAVLRNSTGTITQSDPFTPLDSTQTNTYHSFYFKNPVSFSNEDFYIGLAQQASATPYRPVAVQYENAVNRAGAFFKANLDGTGLADSSGFGRLMIRAEIMPNNPQPLIDSAIDGKIFLCPSGTRVLRAASIEQRFADSVISYSSQHPNTGFGAIEALGTPNVYPAYGSVKGAWIGEQPDSTGPNKHEYIELRFPNPGQVNFIDIYETVNPGAVDTVWVKNPGTLAYDTVFTRIPDTTLTPVARKYHVTFTLTSYLVSQVKIALNSGKIPGYNGIDAVAIGKITQPATYSNYLWTGPGIVGANNTQAITVNATGNYKVTVTTAAGCLPSSDSVTVVSAPASVSVTPAGPINLCIGDSIWLKSSIQGGNVWSTGSTADSIKVKLTGTYSLTNNVGCGVLNSNVVTVTRIDPTATISGNLAICPTFSTILNAGPGDTSYLWKDGTGATLSSSQTVTVSTAGLIKLVIDSLGCKDSAFVVTTSAPAATPVISGNLQFCPGSSTVLDAGIFTTYQWRNGVGTVVGATRFLTVTTADNFNVTVTNGSGCTGVSPTVTTSLYPFTPPTISGLTAFCPGGSVALTASAGYQSYIWGPGGQTTQAISVNTAGTYTINVVSFNGCTGSANIAVTQSPLPSPVITGNLQFCSGGSTVLNAGAGFASYEWTLNGTTIVGTSQTLNVTTIGNYTVKVSNAFGCFGTSPTVTVSLLTAPVPNITGNTTFCPGGTVTLTASGGFSSYSWSPGGAITQAITVNTAGIYTVTVTNAIGCTGNTSVTVTQAAPPTPVITGALTFCAGSTTTLNAGAGYSSYSWSPGGATTQTLTVNTAGTFTVTVTNAAGCSGSANATTSIVNAVPAKPGPIAGPVSGLCNTNGNVYSIAPVAGANFYVWTVPSGATIIGPSNGVSITVNYSTLFTTGDITVAAFNICGQNPTNDPRTLAVTSIPQPPGPITGPVNGVCQQNGVVYSIVPVAAATSYTWSVPAGATILGGQGTNSVTINFSNAFIAGTISVLASSNCGSSTATSLLVNGITVTPGNISGATIGDCRMESQTYSIAAVSGAVSYTWVVPPRVTILSGQGTTSVKVKFDDDFVTGDLCVYTNTTCGRSAYKCMTVFESPCPNFIIYPNPTSGIVKALVKFGPYGKYTLRIANFLTQVVYEKEFTWNGIDLVVDLSRLPSGVYDVTIYNDSYKRTTKLVKIN